MLRRLPELAGERAKGVQLDIDGGTIGDDPEVVQEVVMAREHLLLVSELLGE
jgi:hypothetical protein